MTLRGGRLIRQEIRAAGSGRDLVQDQFDLLAVRLESSLVGLQKPDELLDGGDPVRRLLRKRLHDHGSDLRLDPAVRIALGKLQGQSRSMNKGFHFVRLPNL